MAARLAYRGDQQPPAFRRTVDGLEVDFVVGTDVAIEVISVTEFLADLWGAGR